MAPLSFSLDQFGLVSTQRVLDRLQHRPQLGALGIRLDEIDHPPQDGPFVGIEVALILAAEATKGEVIDFRSDTTPQTLLGVRLVTAPRADPSPGTSPQHVITFGGARW